MPCFYICHVEAPNNLYAISANKQSIEKKLNWNLRGIPAHTILQNNWFN